MKNLKTVTHEEFLGAWKSDSKVKTHKVVSSDGLSVICSDIAGCTKVAQWMTEYHKIKFTVVEIVHHA